MQEGVRVTTVGEKRSMLNRAEECSLDEFYFFFFDTTNAIVEFVSLRRVCRPCVRGESFEVLRMLSLHPGIRTLHQASVLLPLGFHLTIFLHVVVEFPCFFLLLGFQLLREAGLVLGLFGGCTMLGVVLSEVLEHLVHGTFFCVVVWDASALVWSLNGLFGAGRTFGHP
jgi:hypothetical protein